ncbi:uncharacterized protein LOC119662646 [Teleopsis dalmanni]|uniref:uncharacterized protein LOC119662646 n=1 Tax=Teleopsis dalmanni TaxID=139649 RepID=UPI0018CE42E8|nr:uncharacterized protein LOC119662646 [Teleopsis dalmanni]
MQYSTYKDDFSSPYLDDHWKALESARLVHINVYEAKYRYNKIEDDTGKNLTDDGKTNITEESAVKRCLNENANAILGVLRREYPVIYDQLKEIPNDELRTLLNSQRLQTSHQRAFGGSSMRPKCGNMNQINQRIAPKDISLNDLYSVYRPCTKQTHHKQINSEETDEYGNLKTFCKKKCMLPKIDIASTGKPMAKPRTIVKTNLLSKHPNVTEYLETINRSGCMIMHNRIHDHSRCGKGTCSHHIYHQCANLGDDCLHRKPITRFRVANTLNFSNRAKEHPKHA